MIDKNKLQTITIGMPIRSKNSGRRDILRSPEIISFNSLMMPFIVFEVYHKYLIKQYII